MVEEEKEGQAEKDGLEGDLKSPRIFLSFPKEIPMVTLKVLTLDTDVKLLRSSSDIVLYK